MRSKVCFISMIMALFCTSIAYSDEMPALYHGIRPLGMGNAFITLSDDENALFYNPAGLNDISGFGSLELLNPTVTASKNSIDLFKSLQDVDTNDVSAVTELLSDNMGSHNHIRASLFPNLTFHNFGMGGLGQATLDAEIRNRANPEVIADGKIDIGGTVGIARGFMNKTIQVGISGKIIQRQGINKTYTAIDIASENFDPFEEDLEKEQDFSLDFGTKINFPILFNPTIGVVVQNITDLDFKGLGKIPQQINVGIAINPKIWFISTTLVAEVDDLTKEMETDKDLYKRVHLGAELRLPKILSLRGGFNQGYYSAGATIDLWFLKIVAATYGEELGAFAGQKEDRRYIAQINLGF